MSENINVNMLTDAITQEIGQVVNYDTMVMNSLEQLLQGLFPNNMTINCTEITDMIDQLLQTNADALQIDYAQIISQITSTLNAMGIDDAHINQYIPDLIGNLSQAQNLSQAWEIIEPVLVLHLNLILFNETTSNMDLSDLLVNFLTQELVNLPEVQQLLTNPIAIQVLEAFNETYTETGNSTLALQQALNTLLNILYLESLDVFKGVIAQLWPQLGQSIQNDTDPRAIAGKGLGEAIDSVESFFAQFQITVPTKSTSPQPTTQSLPPTPPETTSTTTAMLTTTTNPFNGIENLVSQNQAQQENNVGGFTKPNLQPVLNFAKK
jgi:hypothetical protein